MSSWKYLFSLFAIMMVALPVQADEVQQRIFEENLKRAEAGDANSQFIVGHRYEIGVGTQKNLEKAFEWYSKAAQKHHPLALLKTEMRNEETDKESRARQDSELARRAEQQSRAEAEARHNIQQAEAARKRKAAETAKLAVAQAKPVAVAPPSKTDITAKPVESVSESQVNAMEVVLGNLWQANKASAEILPSPNTSCLRTASAEVTCFTGESQQIVGATKLSYAVKSVLNRFAKDGSFLVQYVYNVTDVDKADAKAAAGSHSLSEIKPRLGWQEPGYTANCRAGTDRNIQCVTDRKLVVQFVKM